MNEKQEKPAVLVVEDDDIQRELLKETLEDSGFNVLTAKSAEKGLQVLAKNQIDVVVSDVRLPGMDGLSFLERIKEELRKGRGILPSVESGFSNAWATILDANITTLIASAVLFQFGTGPIKGFAVTLSLGIVSSMFTAVFVSKVLLDILIRYKPLAFRV